MSIAHYKGIQTLYLLYKGGSEVFPFSYYSAILRRDYFIAQLRELLRLEQTYCHWSETGYKCMF